MHMEHALDLPTKPTKMLLLTGGVQSRGNFETLQVLFSRVGQVGCMLACNANATAEGMVGAIRVAVSFVFSSASGATPRCQWLSTPSGQSQ